MVDTLDISNMFAYDMFEGDTKVGTCNISIHSQYSGFQCPDTWKDKSVLEIDGFGTFQRNGYGRAGLQKCYELSQQMGCEGRIVVHATWGAGSFYEHCGFRVSHRVKDFFTNNYDHPVFDDGKLLADMVYLRKDFA